LLLLGDEKVADTVLAVVVDLDDRVFVLADPAIGKIVADGAVDKAVRAVIFARPRNHYGLGKLFNLEVLLFGTTFHHSYRAHLVFKNWNAFQLLQGKIARILCRHDLVPANAAKIFVADDALFKRCIPHSIIHSVAAHAKVLGHGQLISSATNLNLITFKLPCLFAKPQLLRPIFISET
jgi:hypothetical protein